MSARFFAVSAAVFDHPIVGFHNPRYFTAWMWLIANAAWKAKRVNHKGAVLSLAAGEVLVARSFLADKWGWGEQEVRTFLKRLVDDDMIEILPSKGHFANTAKIKNFAKYQRPVGDLQPVPNQSPATCDGEQVTKNDNETDCENQSLTSAQPPANQSPTRAQPEPNHTLTKNTKGTKERGYADASAQGVADTDPKADPAAALRTDHDALQAKLLGAANGSLANFAAAPGLLNLSTPRWWIEQGCDLDRDVLPAIAEVGRRRHGAGISSWEYFTKPVTAAKAKRLKALPEVPEDAAGTAPASPEPAPPADKYAAARAIAAKEAQVLREYEESKRNVVRNANRRIGAPLAVGQQDAG